MYEGALAFRDFWTLMIVSNFENFQNITQPINHEMQSRLYDLKWIYKDFILMLIN